MFVRLISSALASWLMVASVALGANAPLGGFIPYVGVSLTDEFKNANTDLTGTFFIADPEYSLWGNQLSGGATPYYDIALLDTGAATHILTHQASGTSGFSIVGNGFGGTNFQQIGGATGLVNLAINDPLGVFVAGLGDRTSGGATLQMDTNAFRGQSSFATLSAPASWELPNIIGLPMAAHHAISIQNSNPQLFELNGRTVRTPQVEFRDLGSGSDGIVRRAPLKVRPGSGFIVGPLYIQNLDILGGNLNFHDNPLSPSIIENGAMFIDVDMHRGTKSLVEREFLFDTGADLTVVSEITAKRLGFDPILDTPDFVLEVEGSGGVQGGIPGFYLDSLNIDTVGGNFTMHNVPIAVLDVTNPNDPGNVIDGILGMHLFTGRDLFIDANPSIGQGGVGPSVYISDPVTQTRTWATGAPLTNFATADNWSAPGVPDIMTVAEVRSIAGRHQTAVVDTDATVFQLIVSGEPNASATVSLQNNAKLTSFGETRIESGGVIDLAGGKLDAQFVNIFGGTLRGSGEIFVGTGPINSAVRVLSGRVEPGAGGAATGTLAITGDYSASLTSTLAIDLAGLTPGSQHDVLTASRHAFLAGTLEVSLAGGFQPSIGDSFSIISATRGVEGEFDQLLLPAGFVWDVNYNSNSVVLEVVDLGSMPGDFNGDGVINGADLTAWQNGFGQPGGYDGHDFLAWQRGYSVSGMTASSAAVPEPSTVLMMMTGIACGLALSRKRLIRPTR